MAYKHHDRHRRHFLCSNSPSVLFIFCFLRLIARFLQVEFDIRLFFRLVFHLWQYIYIMFHFQQQQQYNIPEQYKISIGGKLIDRNK